MSLTKEQEEFFRRTMVMTREQIQVLNGQIEEELSKVKARLEELDEAKKAAKQIYDGACRILGVENELETEEAEAREEDVTAE